MPLSVAINMVLGRVGGGGGLGTHLWVVSFDLVGGGVRDTPLLPH